MSHVETSPPHAGRSSSDVPGRGADGPAARADGALLFVRYAYPPNAHGYCGPADSAALLHYGAAGVVDAGLVELIRGFSGAWPYLELIAGVTGIGDPLDRRVVEAYWVGNALLGRIEPGHLAASLEERFRPQLRGRVSSLAESVLAGGLPHHAFHVFAVYPWVGFLGDGPASAHALHVLDRCRIRWGQVVTVDGDQVVVRSRALTWDGRALALGAPTTERAVRALDGVSHLGELAVGAWVSLHWDWVCDQLSERQLRALRHHTRHQLTITNRLLARSPLEAALT